MSRKDYLILAAVVNTIRCPKDRRRVAEELATRLKKDNPRFDPTKFLNVALAT